MSASPASADLNGAPVDFSREVRPILSDNCFTCHGPDENQRKARLRLDTQEGLFAERRGGRQAAVPGDSGASLLIERIIADDGLTTPMPPPETGKSLTDAQIDILKRWIDQGAEWQEHWAFVPPGEVEPPAVAAEDSAAEADAIEEVRNPIDAFIRARLEREGLTPSPPAQRETLIRRVTLDLTGLPPTVEEVEAFLADDSPDAYEKVVDRLLASTAHAERMALHWLDLARYADTHGYHIDSHRDMWRWRDWVIEAFKANKSFDTFTIEQLAGDLLPDATLDQKLATGFNRNHMINYEGGAIDEEYRVQYVFDRTNTTATVWMGMTFSCAQCHDHKYDPISMREYYAFFAFFNNIPEKGMDGLKGNAVPFIKAPLPVQQEQLDALRGQIAEVEKEVERTEPALAEAQTAWEPRVLDELPAPPTEALTAHYEFDRHLADTSGHYHHGRFYGGDPVFEEGRIGQALKLDGYTYVDVGAAGDVDHGDAFSYGGWVRPDGQEAMTPIARMGGGPDLTGYDLYLSGGKVYAHLIHKWPEDAIRVNTAEAFPHGRWHHLMVTYDGSSKAEGVRIYVNGAAQAVETTQDSLTGSIRTATPLEIGRRSGGGAAFKGMIDDVRLYARALDAAEVEALAVHHPLRSAIATGAGTRTERQRNMIRREFLAKHAPEELREPHDRLADLQRRERALVEDIPTSMVMEELETPRETFVLLRGDYATHGDKVEPGVPEVLPPLSSNGARADRLALARWLVEPSHPLTARVTVNRFWQMYFGEGLVRTAEDFGVQGEPPTHPELLDWLAAEFVRNGWDIRAMQRLIVTSATYRQSSRVTPDLLERDPRNRLLARGPRLRLQAEFVRDGALAIGGLLDDRVGGPSVFPYQPPGLWEAVAYGQHFTAQRYVQSHGDDLYRRSMYTFWKRSMPPAAMTTFDAPDREVCMVRRSRTNTPLQALALMNDVTFVEAARAFAERIIADGGETFEERITFAFRRALARAPGAEEIDLLRDIHREHAAHFSRDVASAIDLVIFGEYESPNELSIIELATWTTLANMILNLDETITKG